MKPEQAIHIIRDHWAKKKFVIHRCHLCDYPCGFIFKENKIFYDSGCNCVEKMLLEEQTEEFLLHVLGKNPEIIEQAFKEENILVQ